MKKLFISVPMKGRTEAQIRATMEQMHHIAEAVFGEELEVIQTYISDDPPADANKDYEQRKSKRDRRLHGFGGYTEHQLRLLGL